jgi:hypothetical protein
VHRVNLAVISLLWTSRVAAFQVPIPGSSPDAPPLLAPGDQAVLDEHESRRDLPCGVRPLKPELNFDLRFHAGYETTVQIEELAKRGDELRIIFRATATDPVAAPIHFSHRIQTPSFNDQGAEGEAHIEGRFDVGEGKYHVDWLMRARDGRLCSHHWSFEASLPSAAREVALAQPPGSILAAQPGIFAEEPPVVLSQPATDSLKLTLMVNVTPSATESAVVPDGEMAALVGALRAISREQRVGEISLTAFKLDDPQLLYRQPPDRRIDFTNLGRAIRLGRPGTVSTTTLSRKHPADEFLAGLMQEESETDEKLDALIFLGPRGSGGVDVKDDLLNRLPPLRCPVFYLKYDLTPQVPTWGDAIGRMVKFFRGRDYTFNRPVEMWFAIRDLLSQIKSKRLVSGAEPAPLSKSR